MLLKFQSVDTKSKVIHETVITFVDSDSSIFQFLSSKNLDIDEILEVRTGKSFSELVCLDSQEEVLKSISFSALKETVSGLLHMKVVVRYSNNFYLQINR